MISNIWQCGRFTFERSHCVIMGIVNVTPDSFSDGGVNFVADQAIHHAQKLIEQGAQIIDIGGESTRPGAISVPVNQEIERIMPVLDALRHAGVAISVDTRKPQVMQAALEAGADIINNVDGFRDLTSRQIVSEHPNCGLCIMHMQGEPTTMQHHPTYSDVVSEVRQALNHDAQVLMQHGIKRNRISIDPGFGFGKTLDHNYSILAHLDQIVALDFPVMIGLSRKSMIGSVLNKPLDQRVVGSVAGALIALNQGAMILRVHDVDATQDALKVWQAVKQKMSS
jgi:dihydropteroate synthase